MLSFFDIDKNYINFLKTFDSKVPNISYLSRDKFVCGVVLFINGHNYYAPISSKHNLQKTNFIIYDKNNQAISSIRFCFMFPAISSALSRININQYRYSTNKADRDYGKLMLTEYIFCNKNKKDVLKKAQLVYKNCNIGVPVYKFNCCDFKLLEANYLNYVPNTTYSTVV